MSNTNESKCPFPHGQMKQTASIGTSNKDWWPNRLNLGILHQHSTLSNPTDTSFNYAQEFMKLDLNAIKKDIFDEWIVSKFNSTLRDYLKSLSEYKINEASQALYDFIWRDF